MILAISLLLCRYILWLLQTCKTVLLYYNARTKCKKTQWYTFCHWSNARSRFSAWYWLTLRNFLHVVLWILVFWRYMASSKAKYLVKTCSHNRNSLFPQICHQRELGFLFISRQKRGLGNTTIRNVYIFAFSAFGCARCSLLSLFPGFLWAHLNFMTLANIIMDLLRDFFPLKIERLTRFATFKLLCAMTYNKRAIY